MFMWFQIQRYKRVQNLKNLLLFPFQRKPKLSIYFIHLKRYWMHIHGYNCMYHFALLKKIQIIHTVYTFFVPYFFLLYIRIWPYYYTKSNFIFLSVLHVLFYFFSETHYLGIWPLYKEYFFFFWLCNVLFYGLPLFI